MGQHQPGKKWYEMRFLNAKDSEVTDASKITVRESLWPLFLVTILYFLWVSLPTFHLEELKRQNADTLPRDLHTASLTL